MGWFQAFRRGGQAERVTGRKVGSQGLWSRNCHFASCNLWPEPCDSGRKHAFLGVNIKKKAFFFLGLLIIYYF